MILGQPDFAAAFLREREGVRWVQSTWAGLTPLLELDLGDLLLTGVKDVFGPQISEYVFAYLLAHELGVLERLGRQANRSWWPEPTGSLAGKTMGIMGTGSIGRHLAGLAGHFGIAVLGLSRGGAGVDGFDAVFSVDRLQEFLKLPDYLVCALPETPATRGLLDESALAALKPGCYLVNVGRGSLLDEQALQSALRSGHLAGAALDVFREEPLPPHSPLWHTENLMVTAHVAAKSRPADIALIFLENFERYRQDRELNYLVDPKRGY